MAPITTEELEQRLADNRHALANLIEERRGEAYTDDDARKHNELDEAIEADEKLLGEFQVRDARAKELAEGAEDGKTTIEGANFYVQPERPRGRDIYDLSSVPVAFGKPEVARNELHDRAKTSIEMSQFHQPHMRRERAQEVVEKLLERDNERGDIAVHILRTGDPKYKTAWTKAISQGVESLSGDEQRTLQTAGTAGGYAVPYTLDPTVIPTSDWSVNPFRAISRVETITTTTWQGVSSAGVTAQFDAELTEADDNSPQFAQPSITPNKAQCFVPFSIEIGQDWAGIQAELGKVIGEAKDDLEAARMVDGTAASSVDGIQTGATAYYASGGTATFSTANLFNLETALGPRFRARASIVGNRAMYNKVRQFGAEAGTLLWQREGLRPGLANEVPEPGRLGENLLGYPTYESSNYASAFVVGGDNYLLTIGDFSYYAIIDRLGMTVELVPHVFGSNQRPTGARGIYAYWRVGAEVLSSNAFRHLKASAT